MPARRMRSNRLPVAPPPLRSRVHSPSSAPRESSLDRVRRLAREHRATEKPFEPTRRGTWQGSSRDLVVNGSDWYAVKYVHKISPSDKDVGPDVALPSGAFSDSKKLGAALRKAGILAAGGRVNAFRAQGDKTIVFPSVPGLTTYWHAIVLTHLDRDDEAPRSHQRNPARARRGAKHVALEPSEDFLVIEEDDDDRYPFVLVNPTEYDSYMKNSIFAFAFGAYGWTRLIVWEASDHIDDALEKAGEWLAEHAPGILTSEEEIGKLIEEAKEEDPSLDDEDAFSTATQDMTYTESGWIPSWEWTVSEFTDGDLFDVTLKASKEEYEREYGEDAP